MAKTDTLEARFSSLDIPTDTPAPAPKRKSLKEIVDAAPRPEINPEAFKVKKSSYGERKATQQEDGTFRTAGGRYSLEGHRNVGGYSPAGLGKRNKLQPYPLHQLRSTVADQQTTKRDLIVPRKDVRLTTMGEEASGALVTREDLPTLPAQAEFLPSGIRGLTDFTDIPTEMVKYLVKKDLSKELTTHINRELGRFDENSQFMLRLRKDDDGQDVIRHVASQEYAVIDNIDAMEILQSAFNGDSDNVLVTHAHNDADTLYCNLLLPDNMKAMPDSNYGVGIAITNSEIGVRSFSVAPFLFREICLNGVVFGKMNSVDSLRIRQRHTGPVDIAALAAQVAQSLEVALTAGWSLLDRMQWARSAKIKNVPGTITHLARSHKLQKAQAKTWLERFAAEPDHTGFGIIQGLTLAAQDYSGETRYQMESLAGTILAPSLEADLRDIMSHWEHIDHMGQHTPEKVIEQYVGVRA